MKIFNVKIKPILQYGLNVIAPRLNKANLLELDIAKSRFLKKALCLPMSTNNDAVYDLCGTERFCVTMKEKGVAFNEEAYEMYIDFVARKKALERKRKRNPLAYEDTSWMGINQPRHFVVGFSVHGFHWCLCEDRSYHERDEECYCRFCGDSAAEVDHLEKCTALYGELFDRYKTVTGHGAVEIRVAGT